MALGALEALKARNLLGKVKLIGFDALPEALGQIKAGNLTATIEQLPGGQVRGALQTLVAFLRDGKKPDQQVILLTPIAITSDNLNQAERLERGEIGFGFRARERRRFAVILGAVGRVLPAPPFVQLLAAIQ